MLDFLEDQLKSFTGLEITEFDIISKEIDSKYHYSAGTNWFSSVTMSCKMIISPTSVVPFLLRNWIRSLSRQKISLLSKLTFR